MSAGKRTIIFDMDGVLFDTESLALEFWEKVGRMHGLTGFMEVAADCIGISSAATRLRFEEHFGPDAPYEAWRAEKLALTDEYYREYGIPLKPGVFELMDFLKSGGFAIGLATSTSRENAWPEICMSGLDPYFDASVCGDELKRSKPYPDIYLACLEKLGADAADTWVIEDSYNGIRSAHAALTRPIMVPDLLPPTDEMRSLAVHICGDLHEVRKYLESQPGEAGDI